ncbi:hypothetical protein [Streptomyces lydicus]
MLRLAPSAVHTPAEVEACAAALDEVWRALGLAAAALPRTGPGR